MGERKGACLKQRKRTKGGEHSTLLTLHVKSLRDLPHDMDTGE